MQLRKPIFQLSTITSLLMTSMYSFADPVVDGNDIVLTSDSPAGWYQVQRTIGNYDQVCGETWNPGAGVEWRCPITESGSYQVINHGTGKRYPLLEVNVTNNDSESSGNSGVDCSNVDPRVDGNNIVLNSSCSWTVQRDTSTTNSCDGNISSCDNLPDGNYTVWRWSGANNQFELTVGDGSTESSESTESTETTPPDATQTRGRFPLYYDVDGVTNLDPGQYDVSIDGTGNYFFDWAVIGINGCNWDGPITAFVDEPVGSNGAEFSLELRNDNQYRVGHCETDIAVTKTGYRDGNGYPKEIRSIEQSSNSNESNLNVTANGRWSDNSTGRGHVNMTVWLTKSASRDFSSRAFCKQGNLTEAELDENGCGTVDIIIHGFDNSGDMAQNNDWELLDQTVSMQDPENPGGNIDYHIIKRAGDLGERSSYNIQPVHRASAAYVGDQEFPTHDYNMEFDVMDVINTIINSDDSEPFTKDWYVHDMQWTITGQVGNEVGGKRINGIDGKFTFDRFTIPSFSAENWSSESRTDEPTQTEPTQPTHPDDSSSGVCTVSGNTFGEAITNYDNQCSLPRNDCDPVDGKWYCSSAPVGNNPIVTIGSPSPETPEESVETSPPPPVIPEPDTQAPTISYVSPGAETSAGAITISGKAVDDSGIKLVRAFLLGQSVGNQRYNFKDGEFNGSTVYADTVKAVSLTNQSATNSDWSFSIDNLEPGNYRLRTKVWDNENNSTTWANYDFKVVSGASARQTAMSQAIAALEDYKRQHGTFKVANSGWRGNGSGWFFYDGANYPTSVADALTIAGNPVILTDPLFDSSSAVRGDFLIYHCKDRVGLFSRHGTSQETTSVENESWWNSNACPRHPLDSLNANYFMLSQ